MVDGRKNLGYTHLTAEEQDKEKGVGTSPYEMCVLRYLCIYIGKVNNLNNEFIT